MIAGNTQESVDVDIQWLRAVLCFLCTYSSQSDTPESFQTPRTHVL